MKYNLLYTSRAERDIKKLDPSIKRQIGKAILRLQNNPVEHSEKLTDPKIGTYRFRVGDYRVIFDMDGNNIVILRVGHRKEIYRKI
jgi:mRNA interferase RelE/StbE